MNDASAGGASGGALVPGTRVAAVREQASAALPGETIILGMREGVYYAVSDVGARIWALCGAPTTLGAVHAAIVREFEVPPPVAWEDLTAFVTALRDAGLVTLDPPAASGS